MAQLLGAGSKRTTPLPPEPKVSVPLLRTGLVDSPVLERLVAADARIVAVTAPPGYGKTTLMSQWAALQTREVAWLTLDHHEDDPANLLSWLALALAAAGAPIDTSRATQRPFTVRAVGRALASMPPLLLVLDDLHQVTSQPGIDVLTELVRYLPPGSCLALCGRAQTVPLGGLRTSVEMLEIGTKDLAFGVEDARRLLEGAGIEVRDRDLGGLVAATEGWPAALYLAALGVRAGVEPELRTVDGDNRLVADYLRDQVMAALPAQLARFLARTSFLRRLSGPLCDYVLQDSGSALALERLAASSLLVLPMGSGRQWYRYHALLRESLLADMLRTEPEGVAELQARASDWHAREGSIELALDYADDARDIDRLGTLLLRFAQPLWQTGRGATAETWLTRLEQRGYLASHPELAAAWVLVLALVGRGAEAQTWQVLAQAGSGDDMLPDGSTLAAWQANARAFLCESGPEQMGADADEAIRLLCPASAYLATAMGLKGISQLMLGDAEGAVTSFEDATATAIALGASVAGSVALAERALLAIGAGQWGSAAGLAEQAMDLVATKGAAEYGPDALTYAVTARIALHHGKTQAADAALVRAAVLRPLLSFAMPYLAVQVRLLLAQCHLLRGDAGGARVLVTEMREVLRRRPRLGRFVEDVDTVERQARSVAGDSSRSSTLTVAELRLLPLLATHLSFRGIGDRLFLSPHTIKTQALSIYRKFGVSSRAAAVDAARELGLLEA